ncbi:hypothetical protein HK405_014049, partial [Cladochytrium tenue]
MAAPTPSSPSKGLLPPLSTLVPPTPSRFLVATNTDAAPEAASSPISDAAHPARKPSAKPSCPHGRRRTQCLACHDLGIGGGSICSHRRRKDRCSMCRSSRHVASAAASAASAASGPCTIAPHSGAAHSTRSGGSDTYHPVGNTLTLPTPSPPQPPALL